jgi:putative tryptophan/tyrosine transport system substrate-binding protein
MPVVGWLSSVTASDPFGMSLLSAFRAGLKDADYVEGQNVAIDLRWGEGQYSRLPTLAAELVGKRVDVIMAGGPPELWQPKRRPKQFRSFSPLARIRSGSVLSPP